MVFAVVREQRLQSLSNACSEGSNPFLLNRTVIVTYINRSIERWETSSENLHVHKGTFQRFFSFTLTFSVLIVYATLWSINLHWWRSNNPPAPPRQSSVWHCWSSLNDFVWISAAETTVDKKLKLFSETLSPRCMKSCVTPSVTLAQPRASVCSTGFSSNRLAERNTTLPTQPRYLLFQTFTVFSACISTFISNGDVLPAERRHTEN